MPVIAEMLHLSAQLYDQICKDRSDNTSDAINRAGEVMKAADDVPVKSSAFIRGRKLFQLDVNYRWSTVVFDERFKDDGVRKAVDVYGVAGRATRAGDRAPDAPALVEVSGARTRLFDVLDPAKHTALIFATPASAQDALTLLATTEAFRTCGLRKILILPKGSAADADWDTAGVDVLEDSEGHAFEGYGIKSDATSPTLVIVRPDGMIGAFVTSEAGAKKYINVVFS